MSGMLAKILDVGTSIPAFGNAARPAVPVPYILRNACGTSDLAPSPGKGASLERFAGLTINDNGTNAGNYRQAVKFGDDQRIIVQIDCHFRGSFPCPFFKDAITANLTP